LGVLYQIRQKRNSSICFLVANKTKTNACSCNEQVYKKGDKVPAAEIEKVYNIIKIILKPNVKNSAKVKTEMKYFSLAGMKDKYIGKAGTNDRS